MDELDRFKREIDLRKYAESLGYEWDKKDSWKGEYVMRSAGGDKISVAFNESTGHWMYASLRGDLGDRGTIVDFALRRRRYRNAYRDLIAELNAWLAGAPWKVGAKEMEELRPVPKDFQKVRNVWESLDLVPPQIYLETERKIPTAVLLLERFQGCMRSGRNGNVGFPHYAVDGTICGLEFKGPGLTRFMAGSRKTIWQSRRMDRDSSLVICESAIECLSYAALYPDDRTRYVSTAGSVTAQLPELRQAMREMPPESDIVGAMNPDQAGALWNRTLHEVFQAIGREDLNWRIHYPETAEDWNDELKRKSNPLPAPLPEGNQRKEAER